MRKITFGVFLLPETNLLDFGGITQAFIEARDFGLNIELIICGEHNEIVTNAGVKIKGVKNYQEIEIGSIDYLFIISANYKYVFSRKFKPSDELLNWVKQIHESGTKICAVCIGAFLIGAAGLLDNIKCTTHWKKTSELKKQFPLSKVHEDVLFIEDNNIITSAGSSSGIDLALYIISKIKDENTSHKIARELVMFGRRGGSTPQESVFLKYRNHYHNGIHKVQDYIINNINEKMYISELSDMANMSERNFCRIFKKETSVTVFDYITRIRKEFITRLLENPDLSKKQIANKVGLESERQLNRIIKKDLVV